MNVVELCILCDAPFQKPYRIFMKVVKAVKVILVTFKGTIMF